MGSRQSRSLGRFPRSFAATAVLAQRWSSSPPWRLRIEGGLVRLADGASIQVVEANQLTSEAAPQTSEI
jgi:hypothetical protein